MSTIVLAETNASTRKRLTRILAKNRYTIKQLKPSEDVEPPRVFRRLF